MIQVEMSATVRTAKGKGPMRRLRVQGLTPAVVYGAGGGALALQMNTKELMTKLLEIVRRNAIVNLKVDGNIDKSVVLKEVQTDPINDTLIHVDFCEIDLDKAKVFTVPLNYSGTAKGVDLGGRLETYADSVLLAGKPLDIPNEVTLSVSGINIGEQLTFSAISLPENVTLVSKADVACVGVVK